MNLGEVLRRLKRLDEAERMARLALDNLNRAPKPVLESASAMIGLGKILADRGRSREAERFLTNGLALRRERLGQEHPDVKRAEAELEQFHARHAKARGVERSAAAGR